MEIVGVEKNIEDNDGGIPMVNHSSSVVYDGKDSSSSSSSTSNSEVEEETEEEIVESSSDDDDDDVDIEEKTILKGDKVKQGDIIDDKLKEEVLKEVDNVKLVDDNNNGVNKSKVGKVRREGNKVQQDDVQKRNPEKVKPSSLLPLKSQKAKDTQESDPEKPALSSPPSSLKDQKKLTENKSDAQSMGIQEQAPEKAAPSSVTLTSGQKKKQEPNPSPVDSLEQVSSKDQISSPSKDLKGDKISAKKKAEVAKDLTTGEQGSLSSKDQTVSPSKNLKEDKISAKKEETVVAKDLTAGEQGSSPSKNLTEDHIKPFHKEPSQDLAGDKKSLPSKDQVASQHTENPESSSKDKPESSFKDKLTSPLSKLAKLRKLAEKISSVKKEIISASSLKDNQDTRSSKDSTPLKDHLPDNEKPAVQQETTEPVVLERENNTNNIKDSSTIKKGFINTADKVGDDDTTIIKIFRTPVTDEIAAMKESTATTDSINDITREGGNSKPKEKPKSKHRDPLGLLGDYNIPLDPNAVLVELDQDIPLLSPTDDINNKDVAVTPNASIRVRSESSNYYPTGDRKFVYSASIPPITSSNSATPVEGGHFFTNYPLVCLFCGQGFYNRTKLKNHLTSKHANCYTNELEKSHSFVNLDYPDVGACTGDVPGGPGVEDIPKRRRSRAKFEEVMRALKPVPRTALKPSPTRKFPESGKKLLTATPSPSTTSMAFVAGQKRKLVLKSSIQIQALSSKSSATTTPTSPKKNNMRGRPKKVTNNNTSITTKSKQNRSEVSSATDNKSSPTKKKKSKQQSESEEDEESSESDSDSDSSTTITTSPTKKQSVNVGDNHSDSSSDDNDTATVNIAESKYRCEWCDQLFNERKTMKKHINRHFKGAKLNLLTCDSCFCLVERHLLRRHMHKEHNDLKLSQKRMWCEYCNYSVKRTAKKNFEKHIFEKHPSLLKVECRICDARFLTTSLYNQHFQATHGKSLDEQTMECLFCNKKFETLNKLYCHFSVVHMKKNENFYCALCSKYFYGSTDLDSHQEEFHKSDDYQCGLCLVDFDSVESCERHVMVHKQKSDYQCVLCNFYFDSDVTLANHKSTHSNDDVTTKDNQLLLAVKCLSCQSVFNTIDEFKKHRQRCHSVENDVKKDGSAAVCDLTTQLRARCVKCDLNFDDEKLFYDHFAESHSGVIPTTTGDGRSEVAES